MIAGSSSDCNFVSWEGNKAVFNCDTGSDGDKEVRCTVDSSKSYKEGDDKTLNINVDGEAPDTTINPDGTSWISKDKEFELSCSDDDSSCSETYYTVINHGSSCPDKSSPAYESGSAPITDSIICSEGNTCMKRVCFYSVDTNGNSEGLKKSGVFKIDKEKPSISCDNCWTIGTNEVVFTPDMEDSTGSGVKSMNICKTDGCSSFYCSGSSYCSYGFDNCTAQDLKFWVHAEDNVGNEKIVEGETVKIRKEIGCMCSYSEECSSGLCRVGECIINLPPEIYWPRSY